MKILAKMFSIESTPTKFFFKCFYLFCVLRSISMIYMCNPSESSGRFCVFIYIGVGVFSVFGMFFNFLNRLFAEKDISYWCSVFMGLVIVSQIKSLSDAELSRLVVLEFLSHVLMFMLSLYRYIFLRDEIKMFLKLRKSQRIVEGMKNG